MLVPTDFATPSNHLDFPIPPLLETVVKGRRKAWVANVARFVQERSSGIVLNDIADEDLAWHSIAEKELMAKLEERIRRLAETVVAPAIVAYVEERFPKEYGNGEFRCVENIDLAIVNSPVSLKEILGEEAPPAGRLLGMCTATGEGENRRAQVEAYLDEFFKLFAEESLDEEGIDDVATQVLLHEFCHALSMKLYLSGDGEFDNARRVASIRNLSANASPLPEFDSLYSRLGYSCNFASPADGGHPIRTFPIINEMNEALTDIIAARVYSRICRKDGFASGGFTVSYKYECAALHQAILEFSDENGIEVGKIYRELEAGYFLEDPKFLEVWENVLLPLASAFSEILSDMRNADEEAETAENEENAPVILIAQ